MNGRPLVVARAGHRRSMSFFAAIGWKKFQKHEGNLLGQATRAARGSGKGARRDGRVVLVWALKRPVKCIAA